MKILRGDVRDIAATLDAESFDGCLCDPPYGLSFMGKKWDYDVPSVATWAAVLGALKPGAHLLAFAGTRTQHRMAVRIEDAGFEIRDMIAWVYGSGFPKSLDVSKAIDKTAGALGVQSRGFNTAGGKEKFDKQNKSFRSDYGYVYKPATDAARQWSGYGTALKPALEPITVARKPLRGTVAENVLKFGTGAINIDGCRVGTEGATRRGGQEPYPTNIDGTEDRSKSWARTGHTIQQIPSGRWPANLIHDGSEEVLAGFPEAKSAYPNKQELADAYAGSEVSLAGAVTSFGGSKAGLSRSDSGSAARFFYCAKASRSEREAGLREAGLREAGLTSDGYGSIQRDFEPSKVRNHHPTVKPLALAEYLARLILPPKRADGKPRRLLVPFSGSGSEIIGALRAGWDEVVGIELSPEYAEIAEARIAHWMQSYQSELVEAV